MLSENQVKRLLKQCENVDETYADICKNEGPGHLDYQRNKGWVQALRLVLEKDTYPIRNTPLEEE
tara:strand:- start:173 stop:367 length:195 start_codon:yes stop_codon:yes gene_type:complete